MPLDAPVMHTKGAEAVEREADVEVMAAVDGLWKDDPTARTVQGVLGGGVGINTARTRPVSTATRSRSL